MELFHKHNHSGFPIACAKQGLAVLSEALDDLDCPRLGVPQVISVTDHELVLPAMNPPLLDPADGALGDGLAKFTASPRYGLANDNYIGLSPQKNGWSDDWGHFAPITV